jgi:AAA domain
VKLGDYEPGRLIKALAFGRFKVGKTFGSATFPRPNYMDFDGGIATLLNPDFVKRHGYKKDIEFEHFFEKSVDKNGVVRSHNAFDDACRYFDKWMAAGMRDKFDTWIVDSATSLSQFAMNKGMILLGGPGLSIASKTHQQAVNTGVVYPKMQDYGVERGMVTQFIRMLLTADKNVLVLCHEKEITDDNGNLKAIVPLLTGKGVEEIPIMFDEVWNVQRRPVGTETVVQIITQQTSILKVGSRLGIPNQTPFEYGAIRKVLDTLEEQRAAVKQPLPTAAVAAGARP